MLNSIIPLIAAALLVGACGGSFPPPSERLAEAQAAERSAREVGAADQPNAQLSLKLAQDQITEAQAAIANGENQRADSLLIRARADAELAIAQARETGAHADTQEAVDDSQQQTKTNVAQGAAQ